MNPELWGECAWKFLHYVTFAYPDNPSEQDRTNYKNFFMQLVYVLPCKVCQLNYRKHIERLPLTNRELSSKISLVKWLFNIHNEVNHSMGKPILGFEKFLALYQNKSKCKNINLGTVLTIILIIFLVVFLIIFLSYTRRRY